MDAIVKASFWTDPRVEECAADVKLACLWLISNPSRDLCGFTQVSNKRFEFETGLDARALQGASKGLAGSFVELPGGVWFSVHFLRHQFGKGGRLALGNKVVVSAARRAAKLPEPLRRAFFEAYPELLKIAPDCGDSDETFEAPSKGDTQNPEGVRVRVRERVGEGKEGCGEKTDCEMDPWAIVHAYPKREGDKEALEAVRRSIKGGATADEILAGTRAIAAIIPQLPSGHLNGFVPGSKKFFENERWRDDPKTWLRGNAGRNGHVAGELHLGGRKAL